MEWGGVPDYVATLQKKLETVIFPDGCKKIGAHAFESCSILALTELPDTITYIDSYAFYYCTNLALTKLPSKLTNIGGYAFSSCRSLAITELPSGITSIGRYAFNNCPKLALTELPNGGRSKRNYPLQFITINPELRLWALFLCSRREKIDTKIDTKLCLLAKKDFQNTKKDNHQNIKKACK